MNDEILSYLSPLPSPSVVCTVFLLPVDFFVLFQLIFLHVILFSKFYFIFSYRNLIVGSLSVFTTLALVNADGFGFDGDFGNECALLLDGPGRTSSFDFNTNTIRGGPQ